MEHWMMYLLKRKMERLSYKIQVINLDQEQYIYMGVSELVDGIEAQTVLLQMEKHRLIYQMILESQETM